MQDLRIGLFLEGWYVISSLMSVLLIPGLPGLPFSSADIFSIHCLTMLFFIDMSYLFSYKLCLFQSFDFDHNSDRPVNKSQIWV